MTIFGAVVQPGTGFNEDVSDVGELGDLGLCGIGEGTGGGAAGGDAAVADFVLHDMVQLIAVGEIVVEGGLVLHPEENTRRTGDAYR